MVRTVELRIYFLIIVTIVIIVAVVREKNYETSLPFPLQKEWLLRSHVALPLSDQPPPLTPGVCMLVL